MWQIPHPLIPIKMIVNIENNQYEIITIKELETLIKRYKIIPDFKTYRDELVSDIQQKINVTNKIGKKGIIRLFKKGYFTQKSKWVARYWTDRGYSLDYAKAKISELQSNNGNKLVSKRISHPDLYNDRYTTQLKYWIRMGFDISEAKLKLKERQATFSLKKCILKHGEVDGKLIFETRQKKWQSSLNNKTAAELYDINIRKCVKIGVASKQSIQVFRESIELLEKMNIEYYIGHSDRNEYYLSNGYKLYLYDFTIPSLNIIVEYNGCKFHVKNPNDDWNSIFKNGKSKEDILKYDEEKIKFAIDRGFDVLVVWSDDSIEINSHKVLNFIKTHL